MSKGLEKYDRQVGIEMAWHGDTIVKEVVLFADAFPYEILKEQVYFGEKHVKNGEWFIPCGSDNGLPIGNGQALNGKSYTLKSPKELWDFAEEITKGTKSRIVSAGTIENRAKFFISKELEELQEAKLEDGSSIKIYFNLLDAVDKKIKRKVGLAGFKVVCKNTWEMSYFLKVNQWAYRHSLKMDARMAADKTEIEGVAGYSAIVKATFDKLIKKSCSIDRARNIYAGFVTPLATKELSTRGEHVVDSLLDCFQNGPGNGQNNEFSLLGALTDRFTHGFPDSKKEVWSTFESSEFGAWATRKQEFSRLLTHGRGELQEIEKRGRELVGVKVSAKA